MKRIDFFLILVGGTILVIAWIVFSIIHNYQTSTLSSGVITQTIPIAPNFNTNVLEKLKQRLMVSPDFNLNKISATQAGILPTPTPTPTPALTPLPTIIINGSIPSTPPTPTPTITSTTSQNTPTPTGASTFPLQY